MKSSTIRRSNLSKEKIAVLEALSKFNHSEDNSSVINDHANDNEPVEDGSPEVYVRKNKEKELDLLWKDFKMPKGERSPIVYLGMGFIAGIITTILVSAFIGMSSGNFHMNIKRNTSASAVTVPAEASSETTVSENTAEPVAAEENSSNTSSKKFSIFGSSKNSEAASSESSSAQNKEYEVQSGDTMEKIVRSFYGTYSADKVEAIMNANNMTDPNRLSIGQKLIIPSDGIVENSAQ